MLAAFALVVVVAVAVLMKPLPPLLKLLLLPLLPPPPSCSPLFCLAAGVAAYEAPFLPLPMTPDLPALSFELTCESSGFTTLVVSRRQPGVTRDTPTVSVTNLRTTALSPAGSESSMSMLVPAEALTIRSSERRLRPAAAASPVASKISKEMAWEAKSLLENSRYSQRKIFMREDTQISIGT